MYRFNYANKNAKRIPLQYGTHNLRGLTRSLMNER